MDQRRTLAVLLLLALPFAAACGDFKRLAYEDMGRRNAWQHPDRVIEALAIGPGAKIADVGAGGGYFTFRLADAAGDRGRVYAVDVDEGMLEHIAERAAEQGYSQIETVLSKSDDPSIPERVDLVFVSNTYHHLPDRIGYFSRAASYLRHGGRVAVLEYQPDDGGFRCSGHSTSEATIRSEMEAAGYQLVSEFDFLERQSFQVFARPGSES